MLLISLTINRRKPLNLELQNKVKACDLILILKLFSS